MTLPICVILGVIFYPLLGCRQSCHCAQRNQLRCGQLFCILGQQQTIANQASVRADQERCYWCLCVWSGIWCLCRWVLGRPELPPSWKSHGISGILTFLEFWKSHGILAKIWTGHGKVIEFLNRNKKSWKSHGNWKMNPWFSWIGF